jgi:hypothetical protein
MSLLHYQLIKHIYPNGKAHYAVHEYYNAIDDEADIWAVSPVTLWGEDPDDIQRLIIQVLNDIAEHGIIKVEHDDYDVVYADNTEGLKIYETSGDKDEV